MINPTASSAVLASCTPRALHKVTPGGTADRTWSTPAVSVWITRSAGISAITSTATMPTRYGCTYSSASRAAAGSGARPSHSAYARPFGAPSSQSTGNGSRTVMAEMY